MQFDKVHVNPSRNFVSECKRSCHECGEIGENCYVEAKYEAGIAQSFSFSPSKKLKWSSRFMQKVRKIVVPIGHWSPNPKNVNELHVDRYEYGSNSSSCANVGTLREKYSREDEYAVEQISQNVTEKPVESRVTYSVCWNCLDLGHLFKNCPTSRSTKQVEIVYGCLYVI